MFRKVKKRAPKGTRRKKNDDSDDEAADASNQEQHQHNNANNDEDGEEVESTAALLSEARKRTKLAGGKFPTATGGSSSSSNTATTSSKNKSNNVMHQYSTSTTDANQTNADLVTSTVQLHPEQTEQMNNETGTAAKGDDGIFRDKTRSKLLAGPIKVTTSIRTTARFDYQPDICKDYKETGFCGFGDTCIYLHDRGDTMTGWQLEKQWEEEQQKKKEKQERDIQGFVDKETGGGGGTADDTDGKQAALMTDDGLPYACHLCRNHFTNPVVTSCGHFFCEGCIMNRVRSESTTACPICSKDTHGVFNQPTKLINKRRKVLGIAAAKKDNSWEAFTEAFSSASAAAPGDE